MVESGFADKLDSPQWMERYSNMVEDQESSVGYKIEVSLDMPHMASVMDTVWCNLSQETDKRVGGELFYLKKDKAYKSISTHHSHFTVLGITTLDGNPVVCVVIMTGKNWKFQLQLE